MGRVPLQPLENSREDPVEYQIASIEVNPSLEAKQITDLGASSSCDDSGCEGHQNLITMFTYLL